MSILSYHIEGIFSQISLHVFDQLIGTKVGVGSVAGRAQALSKHADLTVEWSENAVLNFL